MNTSKIRFQKVLLSQAVLAASIATMPTASVAAVLEEVIITAQKREQTLQEVPASVSAISGDSVQAFTTGGATIQALAGRVPSLNIESTNGRQLPLFFIRGLGNIDFDVNANQPVSLIFDNVALENSILKGMPLFDISQVEVLKGPQGTLFGRNTTAGVVKIDSTRPTFETEGYASASYGDDATQNYEFAIGGELSDGIASRLSLRYQTRDDFVDNTFNGEESGSYEEYALRLQFLLEPTDDLSALIKLHSFEMNSNAAGFFYAGGIEAGSSGVRSGFDEEVTSQESIAEAETEHYGVAINLEYQLSDALTVTSITAYDTLTNISRGDVDGGLLTFNPAEIDTLGAAPFFTVHTSDGLSDHYQFSQELRFSGDTDNLFYQFGLFYFNEDITVNSLRFNTDNSLQAESDVDQETTSFAVFGQAEYDLTEKLSVTVGLRWTDDEKELEYTPITDLSGFGVISGTPGSNKVDDSYGSWDIALNYLVNDDWSVFGRLATASRGPATVGRGGAISEADTEDITSLEIGFKSTLFDGAARWSATVYGFSIDDQQLTAIGGSDSFTSLLNAEETAGSGFETDFEWQINDYVYLTSNLSYNDTEIQDSNVAISICGSAPSCTVKDPVVGSVSPFGFPIDLVSIDGNSLPVAPNWLYNVALAVTFPLESGSVYAGTDWNWRSDASVFLYDSVEFVAEQRWIGGMRIGYKNEDESLDLAVVGRNITDKIVVNNALDFQNLTAIVNASQFWGVEATYRF